MAQAYMYGRQWCKTDGRAIFDSWPAAALNIQRTIGRIVYSDLSTGDKEDRLFHIAKVSCTRNVATKKETLLDTIDKDTCKRRQVSLP